MTRCAIAAAALAVALVTGCSDGGAAGSSKNGPAFRFAPIVRTDIVRTVEVKGHEYIIFDGCYKGNIIHSESCPCKGGAEKCENAR